MTKYAIEREFLLPCYEHVIIEADSLEAACEKATFPDCDDDDWVCGFEQDTDAPQPIYVTRIVELPDGYDETDAANVIYDDGFATSPIPEEYTKEANMTPLL